MVGELSNAQTYCRTTEYSSNLAVSLDDLQALESLWTLCLPNVTFRTRHDHGRSSIGSLSDLGVCLSISPWHQSCPFSCTNGAREAAANADTDGPRLRQALSATGEIDCGSMKRRNCETD